MRVLLLCVVVGCTVDTASSVRSAIVDGTPAPEEEAVVLVKVVGGIGQCSGTFISPSVVLTAKHCVQAERMPIPHANSVLSIGVGSAFGDTVDYRVRRVDTTPGAYSSGLTGLVGEDVGVITILPDRDGNFPDVDPIGVYRESPVDLVGQDVTFIGYGRQPSGVSGRKMKTTGAITSIQGNVIISRQNICQGDSGGPMVLEGSPREIVGVASFGRSTAPGATCPSAEDGHNRVDVLLGMIDEALLEAGDCPVMEEEICDSIDNNCDGVIDEGCKGLGEACEADNECAFAQLPERFGRGLRGLLENPVTCGDTPSGRVCTRRCDPLTPLTSCSEVAHPFRSSERIATPGAYCTATSGCEGTCVAGEQGSRALGESCDADTDCQSLACLDPGDGERRCVHRCQGGAGACPTGDVCAAGIDACGGCVDPSIVSGARGLGEPCDADAECGSGRCLVDGEDSYCTADCEGFASCPDGFHCRTGSCARGALGGNGDRCLDAADCRGTLQCVEGICSSTCTDTCDDDFSCTEGFCRSDLGVLGDVCAVDDECLSSRCVPVGSEPRCTQPCGAAGGCPSGFACVDNAGELLCARPGETRGGGGGGGCSTAGGTSWPVAGLFLMLIARRRRRL